MSLRHCLAVFLFAFVSAGAHADAAKAPPLERAKVVAAASDVMKQAVFTTLVTIADDGHANARMVSPTAPDQDLVVWVSTNRSSRKIAELRHDPRATLLYFDKKALAYVTLIGTTTLVDDAAEKQKYWQPGWAPFFPQGPKDPEYVLIRFVPQSIEIMSDKHKLLPNPFALVVFDLKQP